MDRREEKVVRFPKASQRSLPGRRRIGDSPVKIVLMVLIFFVLFGAFGAEVHLADFWPDAWFSSESE